MILYVLTSVFASVFGMVAGQQESTRRRCAFVSCACLLLCFFAAFRGLEVGVDTGNYPYMVFNYSQVYTFEETFSRFILDVEPLYLILVWGVSALTHSYNCVLFVSQLFVVAPFAIVLLKKFPDQIGLGIFLYSTVVFGFTLNIIRQSIAFSFLLFLLLLDYKPLDRRTVALGVLIVGVAIGFHLTAALGAALYLLIGCVVMHAGPRGYLKAMVVACTVLSICMLLFIAFGDWLVVNVLPAIKRSYIAQVDYLGMSKGKEFLVCGLHCAFLAYAFRIYLSSVQVSDVSKSESEYDMFARVSMLLLFLAGIISLASFVTPEIYRLSFGCFQLTIPAYLSMRKVVLPSDKSRIVKLAIANGSVFLIVVYGLFGVSAINSYYFQVY